MPQVFGILLLFDLYDERLKQWIEFIPQYVIQYPGQYIAISMSNTAPRPSTNVPSSTRNHCVRSMAAARITAAF